MSTPTPAPKPAASPLGGLIIPLLLIALAGAVFAYFYYTTPKPPPVDTSKILNGYVTDADKDARLANGYADADGDLLADLPLGQMADPPVLYFTEIPGPDPDADEKTWEPFLKHLAAATGKPCQYLKRADPPATPPAEQPKPEPGDEPAPADAPPADAGRLRSFDAQLQALRAGKLHVTAFTTGQVKRAVNTAGFHPLFVPADTGGKASYQIEVLVPANSPAKAVGDLRGKRLAVSALSSNSGAKAPFVLFHDEFKLHPRTDYQIKLVGSYQAALAQVTKGEVDATCIASDLLARELAAGTVKEEQFRRLHKSGEFPKLCFGTSHTLPPDLVAKIKKGFETFAFTGTSVGYKYKADGAVQFRPVEYKKDWQSVRDVDDRLVSILKSK
jgi:phosphonate transport system substrate-binding protein